MLLAILPVLACFILLAGARAVTPPPDGCYPNFTTVEGCDALSSLTIGAGNTGLGWRALFADTHNVAEGAYHQHAGIRPDRLRLRPCLRATVRRTLACARAGKRALVVGAGVWVLQTGGVRARRGRKRQAARQARRLGLSLSQQLP